MTNQTLNHVLNTEQLLLSKMETMRTNAQPEFSVSGNPIDIKNTQPSPSFSAAMSRVLDTVNNHQSVASAKMTAVETGKSDDLVGAMIASQKASLSLSGLIQVRNKVVGSFEDIMKMPV